MDGVVNKLIILSCSRSGSTFSQKLISSNIKDIEFGHEKIQLNGGIGWKIGLTDKMSIKNENFWLSLDSHIILHQVRNPLKVFPTIYTHTPRVVAEIKRNLNIKSKTRLEFAMKYWLKWNRICQEKAEWTYKVEDLSNDSPILKKLMDYVGFNSSSSIIIPKSNTNTRLGLVNKKDISLDNMYDIDTKLTEEIIEFAQCLGYDLCNRI